MNNFYLPFTSLNTIYLAYSIQEQLIKNSNLQKYPNSNISGVYGTFNNLIWNGGRTIECTEFDTFASIKNCLNNINSHNMICKIVFTNCLLEEKHLQDKNCNQILDLIAETGNEIVINSPLLENYIRNKYPNLPLTSSITKGLDFNTYKTAIQQNYKAVVCYPKRNILQDISTLDNLHKQKIELMLNNDCCAYCKIEQQHYKNESYNNLYGTNNLFMCYQFNPNYKRYKELLSVSLDEQIFNDVEYFQDLGIHNYKIRGRGMPVNKLLQDYINILFIK